MGIFRNSAEICHFFCIHNLVDFILININFVLAEEYQSFTISTNFLFLFYIKTTAVILLLLMHYLINATVVLF